MRAAKPNAQVGEGFRNPHNLPTKTCPACGKPFTWRKKWARGWESVVYCSDRCRTKGKGG